MHAQSHTHGIALNSGWSGTYTRYLKMLSSKCPPFMSWSKIVNHEHTCISDSRGQVGWALAYLHSMFIKQINVAPAINYGLVFNHGLFRRPSGVPIRLAPSVFMNFSKSVNISSGIGLLPDGTKSLSVPKLAYYQWGSMALTLNHSHRYNKVLSHHSMVNNWI